MKMTRFVSILFFVCIITFQPILVSAQLQTGLINGMIKDTEGTPLPGATVGAVGQTVSRTSVSDAEGKFFFTALPPGRYEVTASVDGFNSVRLSSTVVEDKDTELCLTLTLAPVNEELLVTAESPIQDGTSTGAGELISLNEAFSQLPVTRTFLNGLQDGEKFLGIDRFIDGGTNLLTGITNKGNFYVIDEQTGNTSPVSSVPLPSGIDKLGYDFNPIARKFRVGYNAINFVYDPFTGQSQTSVNFHYASNDRNAGRAPDVVGLAYNNLFPGATTNALYGIDANNNCLFMSTNPDSGEITTVNRFNLPISDASFDINAGNRAKAIFTFGNSGFSYIASPSLSARDDPQDLKTAQYTGVITSATFTDLQYSDKQFCFADTQSEKLPLNGSRSITTTVVSEGQSLTGQTVSFQIIGGPNQGRVATALTDMNGQTTFSYPNSGQKGTDTIIIASSLLGKVFTCAANTIWTDEPVITGANIKASLNKIKLSGFNYSLWDITALVNDLEVKTKVKNDGSIVLKKTADAVVDCNSDQVNLLVLRYKPRGASAPVQDTEAFATCP